jgi:hypothetical protein
MEIPAQWVRRVHWDLWDPAECQVILECLVVKVVRDAQEYLVIQVLLKVLQAALEERVHEDLRAVHLE